MEKQYWKSIEELNNQPSAEKGNDSTHNQSLLEIINDETAGKATSRRNFLKMCGFGFATAAIASSCENPVKKAIPYLNKPEVITPGMANHYASSYFDGSEFTPVVVRVRDGRPIKIEGNDIETLTNGGTTPRAQASILSLYDGEARLKTPTRDGKATSYSALDDTVIQKLTAISEAGKTTALLTPPIISPSTRQLISEFTAAFPGSMHVVYEPVSCSGMLQANQISFGKAVIPDYKFDRAEVIVSFGADFLGTWLSPAEFAAAYAKTRDLTSEQNKLSYHVQFETGLSITGSKADKRIPIKPSEEISLLKALESALTQQGNVSSDEIKSLAQRLLNNQGKSIVISASNDLQAQLLVNNINQLLGNYGNTIDFNSAFLTHQAIDADFENLMNRIVSDEVTGIVLWGVNPAYDYPDTAKITKAFNKLELSVSLSSSNDETQALIKYCAPGHHYLESWGDAEYKLGYLTLIQPAIRNIYNTRQPQDSLLKWMGREEDYYTYLKNYWLTNILDGNDADWTTTLQKGVLLKPVSESQPVFQAPTTAIEEVPSTGGYELALYETIALGNGQYANNPWLMELPDPISKVCWDNFAAISSSTASKLGVGAGGMITINEIDFPVLVQPGQAEDTISIAVGFGHTAMGKVANSVGRNAYPLIGILNETRQRYVTGINPVASAATYSLASTQMHHSMEGRPIVRETTLQEYLTSNDAGNEMHKEAEEKNITLYKEIKFDGHHWGMAIDLNKCTGCSTCVISCQAENNVPVVGKEEVMKYRIMQWMRIDRYYSGDEKNPEVVFQPLMCQHCDNAPCENVCPVSATNHSAEGLNQIAYNRCVGTKYCINNCPYKVRRFNWFRYATNNEFDYNMNSELGRMVLNPDVTVRERGVVEKCSLCVQRIQEKKLLAKNENRVLQDGEIQPACAQGCPAGAIIFGDLADPDSQISKLFKDPRNYHLLEDLHTLPSVGYLTLVKNDNKA